MNLLKNGIFGFHDVGAVGYPPQCHQTPQEFARTPKRPPNNTSLTCETALQKNADLLARVHNACSVQRFARETSAQAKRWKNRSRKERHPSGITQSHPVDRISGYRGHKDGRPTNGLDSLYHFPSGALEDRTFTMQQSDQRSLAACEF